MVTSTLSWFSARVQNAVSRDVIAPMDRLSECLGIGAVLALTLFFIYHQLTGTGFFTAAFGTFEAVFFYGVVPFAVAVASARLLTRRRNPARPIDMLSNLWMGVTCLWLSILFPLNFAHLGDPLGPLGPLLSWIPNFVAQPLFFIGALASFGTAGYQAFLYIRVKRTLAGTAWPAAAVRAPGDGGHG